MAFTSQLGAAQLGVLELGAVGAGGGGGGSASWQPFAVRLAGGAERAGDGVDALPRRLAAPYLAGYSGPPVDPQGRPIWWPLTIKGEPGLPEREPGWTLAPKTTPFVYQPYWWSLTIKGEPGLPERAPGWTLRRNAIPWAYTAYSGPPIYFWWPTLKGEPGLPEREPGWTLGRKPMPGLLPGYTGPTIFLWAPTTIKGEPGLPEREPGWTLSPKTMAWSFAGYSGPPVDPQGRPIWWPLTIKGEPGLPGREAGPDGRTGAGNYPGYSGPTILPQVLVLWQKAMPGPEPEVISQGLTEPARRLFPIGILRSKLSFPYQLIPWDHRAPVVSRRNQQMVAAILNALLMEGELVEVSQTETRLGYVPTTPANWQYVSPATLQEALDRIAAALGALGVQP